MKIIDSCFSFPPISPKSIRANDRKVLCHLARMILPLNSFLVRGKVLIGSTYGFRKLLPKLRFLALLFMLSSSALPGCLILHTLYLISVSLTAMSLVCSPLGLPRFSCLLFYYNLFRIGNIMFPDDTITRHVTICQQKVSKWEHKINLNIHEKYNILESRKRGTINEYTLLQTI